MKMKSDKVKVEIFVPFGSCFCSYSAFVEKVGHVTSKFKDLVEVQTKSTKSREATQHGVQNVCVVVGGKKFYANFDAKKLEEAIQSEFKT
jgi:hypothetical protein